MSKVMVNWEPDDNGNYPPPLVDIPIDIASDVSVVEDYLRDNWGNFVRDWEEVSE